MTPLRQRSQELDYDLAIDRPAPGLHLLAIETSLRRHTARRDVRFEIR